MPVTYVRELQNTTYIYVGLIVIICKIDCNNMWASRAIKGSCPMAHACLKAVVKTTRLLGFSSIHIDFGMWIHHLL
jgi:hypothetical protein